MGATFILRTDKSEGYATLYARIQNRVPKINIRVSTGLEVDIKEWNKSLTGAKALTTFRTGKGKELYLKLDAISSTIDALIGKSSVSCPLKPSDSTPLKHSTMPP